MVNNKLENANKKLLQAIEGLENNFAKKIANINGSNQELVEKHHQQAIKEKADYEFRTKQLINKQEGIKEICNQLISDIKTDLKEMKEIL